MKLPSYEPAAQTLRRTRSALERFADERGEDVLLRCHLPRLLSGTRMEYPMLARPAIPSALSRAQTRRMRAEHSSRSRRTAPRGLSARLGSGCLFAALSTNACRTQASLHERFGPLRAPQATVRAPRRRTRDLTRQAAELAGDLIAFCRRHDVELPIDSVALLAGFLQTARLLAGWERLLASERPRVVVVPWVYQPRTRALLHAARQAGVPSVYVPHTPLRSEDHMLDLGVDYAALRGVAEADRLAGHGVAGDRLDVVGNPALADDAPPSIDRSLSPVFAPSTENPLVLRPFVDLIRAALGSRVTVCRHPTAGPRGASEFPRQWSVHDGRTYGLLRAGPPVVLQQSSGVALESLHLGIPVIELSFPGLDPEYALIREPYVRFASSSGELREMVASATAKTGDGDREALIEWARQWSWPNGAQAAQRLVALVERAIVQGQRDAIVSPAKSTPDRG